LELVASKALGIGAASFWSEAEKDIAESPTASPERPERRLQDNKATSFFSDAVMCFFHRKNNFVKIRVVSWTMLQSASEVLRF
jgi:hypothetical protein